MGEYMTYSLCKFGEMLVPNLKYQLKDKEISTRGYFLPDNLVSLNSVVQLSANFTDSRLVI